LFFLKLYGVHLPLERADRQSSGKTFRIANPRYGPLLTRSLTDSILKQMKYSKIMRERIHRAKVLFKELDYEIYDGTVMDDTYSAGFEKKGEFAGGFFIDSESKFLEIAFSFSFSPALGGFIKSQLEEMLKICYEFGCYLNIQKEEELSFSIFSKIYFAGLNYYALKETLRDFTSCIEALKEIIEINNYAGGSDESS